MSSRIIGVKVSNDPVRIQTAKMFLTDVVGSKDMCLEKILYKVSANVQKWTFLPTNGQPRFTTRPAVAPAVAAWMAMVASPVRPPTPLLAAPGGCLVLDNVTRRSRQRRTA